MPCRWRTPTRSASSSPRMKRLARLPAVRSSSGWRGTPGRYWCWRRAAADGSRLPARACPRYRLHFAGRSAHAGLEPQRGANACVAMAGAVLDAASLANHAMATTVTPTVASAGITANTVPDRASLTIDVRAVTTAEQQRVDEALRRLTSRVDGVQIEVAGGINRPPLQAVASAPTVHGGAARLP